MVAAIVAVTTTYAQGSLLATLSHEGDISVFYGSNALKSAVTAAASGDVITLSSGQFNAVDITKNITLRGAGMDSHSEENRTPTIIQGDYCIDTHSADSSRLYIEGVYFQGSTKIVSKIDNATFLKCRLYNINVNSNCIINNTTFIHCKVFGIISMYNSTATFSNCIISTRFLPANSVFENCNIFKVLSNPNSTKDSGWGEVNNVSLFNCILFATVYGQNASLPSSNNVYNCIRVENDASFFNSINNNTNKVNTTYSIFKYFKGEQWKDDTNFELTDEAKANFLGIDGTEVGIYGGNMPFSTKPTNPQITKCNVAAKSTVDGKLSVDITVSGAE